MRISDWSSDVCSSDLLTIILREKGKNQRAVPAPDETRLALRAYLGHPELELIDRRLPAGDELLFVHIHTSPVPAHERHGEPPRIGAWSVPQMIRVCGKACGLDAKLLRPHPFRH